eukprot:Skav204135  [mRNA]  locus=scaffold4181:14725:14985:+ [translate_table: standard]
MSLKIPSTFIKSPTDIMFPEFFGDWILNAVISSPLASGKDSSCGPSNVIHEALPFVLVRQVQSFEVSSRTRFLSPPELSTSIKPLV